MNIELIVVGKTDMKEVEALVTMYTKRLNHYVKFAITTLADVRNTRKLSEAEQKRLEGEQILKLISIRAEREIDITYRLTLGYLFYQLRVVLVRMAEHVVLDLNYVSRQRASQLPIIPSRAVGNVAHTARACSLDDKDLVRSRADVFKLTLVTKRENAKAKREARHKSDGRQSDP